MSHAESFALPRSANFALHAQALAATKPGGCIVTAGSRTVDERPRIVPVAVDAVSLRDR